MRLKEEYTPVQNTRTFTETYIKDYLEKRPQLFNESTEIPKMGEARGKIWILRNFEDYDKGYDWERCEVQDLYNLPTACHLFKKRKVCQAFHERAMREKDSTKIYINHFSGVGGAYPSYFARKVNKVSLK